MWILIVHCVWLVIVAGMDGNKGLSDSCFTEKHLISSPKAFRKFLTVFYTIMACHGSVSVDVSAGSIKPILKLTTTVFSLQGDYVGAPFKRTVGHDDCKQVYRNSETVSFSIWIHKRLLEEWAAFVVKEAIANSYAKGGHIYACFLYTSKAFDLVDRRILFEKLRRSGMELEWRRLLMSSYNANDFSVRWNRNSSELFPLEQLVRQGDFLSHLLFSVYSDELLKTLKGSSSGLLIGKTFVGCITYSDDICFLAELVTFKKLLICTCSTAKNCFQI